MNYKFPKLNGTKEEIALAKVVRNRLVEEVSNQPHVYNLKKVLKFIRTIKNANDFITYRKLPYADFAMSLLEDRLNENENY